MYFLFSTINLVYNLSRIPGVILIELPKLILVITWLRMQLRINYTSKIIHLLDRTETNIIFIWSGKVILGEAKPSPNITLPDQINMILGEVLSNKCFIIPATFCAPGPSHALLIQTKRPFTRYQCAPLQVCVLRHLFSNVEFYCVRTGYGVMGSSQFCLKPDERV